MLVLKLQQTFFSEVENNNQMDDTVDYAALVNNYLADERLAQQMQREV